MLVAPITTVAPDGRRVSLTIGRAYEVLGIEAGWYRVLTDENTQSCPNEPVLYEPECFQVVDASEPSFWKNERGDDGERYAYPIEWINVGFFEDYHDGVLGVREQVWRDLRKLYPRTFDERQRSSSPAVAANKLRKPDSRRK